MATRIVAAPERAEHAGRTAPSPSAVADAMARLERAFPDLPAVEHAARHRAAARTTRELSSATKWMAPAEFDRLANMQDIMAGTRTQLAKAHRLDLIGGAG